MTIRHTICAALLFSALAAHSASAAETAADSGALEAPARASARPAAKPLPAVVAPAAPAALAPAPAPLDPSIGQVRVKDIADVQGVRGNQLIGYGLVVGLEGTGDGQSAQFTPSSVVNMLRRFGVNVTVDQVRVKNVAAVMVTADLPAFVKPGSRIDVTVASLGDAKSLQGGMLLQTPLHAASGEVYAVAQGSVSIGGFNFGGGGSTVQKNHVNVGRIPRGAYVEQEVPVTLMEGGAIQITLHEPDITTASRVAAGIRQQLPSVRARAMDAATVSVAVPQAQADDLISFLATIETVTVTPDVQARIVFNERTGTVVMGGNVRLGAGAIAHGAINIKIDNTPVVVPGAPFSSAGAVVVPQKSTTVEEQHSKLAAIQPTSTVEQLVRALNALGVTPRDLISIFQGMKAAGMISAEIEEQ